MIVKVQLSVASSFAERRMLVYNEDQSVRYEAAAPPSILELMAGDLKSFFHAHLDTDGKINLNHRAEWQEW